MYREIVSACVRRLGSQERVLWRFEGGSQQGSRVFQGRSHKTQMPNSVRRRQAGPPTASVCSSPKRGASHRAGGGGCVTTFGVGGKVGLGGRRPDSCLLVPNASRQEAEANIFPVAA